MGGGTEGRVESVRELKGKTTIERRYFLSSLPLGVETLPAVRGHWGVENKLHWVLIVCFREDQSRARRKTSPLCAALPSTCSNGRKQKNAASGKQLNASWDHPYLLRLVGNLKCVCPDIKAR